MPEQANPLDRVSSLTVVKKRNLTVRNLQIYFSLEKWGNFSLFLIDLQLLGSEVGVEKKIIKNQSLNRKNPELIGNEAELRYQYSFDKKKCLNIVGKK